MSTNIEIKSYWGPIMARSLGNGVISWECPSQGVSGITDQPEGWGIPRAEKTPAERSAWLEFMDEIYSCIEAPEPVETEMSPIYCSQRKISDTDYSVVTKRIEPVWQYGFLHRGIGSHHELVLNDPLTDEAVDNIARALESAWHAGYNKAFGDMRVVLER